MYNPFTKFPVTDDWEDHIRRGSLGGIDYKMPVGTPLPAPSAGLLTFILDNGTGGHTATITRKDGSRTQYMHLSEFDGPSRSVREGEIVGLSGGEKGAPGAGSSTGAHLHAHDINPQGVRVPPFTTAPLTIASLPSLSLISGDTMYRLFYINKIGSTPKRWLLVSPELIADGSEETTDELMREVWEDISGMKAKKVNTPARFARIATEAKRLAELAR